MISAKASQASTKFFFSIVTPQNSINNIITPSYFYHINFLFYIIMYFLGVRTMNSNISRRKYKCFVNTSNIEDIAWHKYICQTKIQMLRSFSLSSIHKCILQYKNQSTSFKIDYRIISSKLDNIISFNNFARSAVFSRVDKNISRS